MDIFNKYVKRWRQLYGQGFKLDYLGLLSSDAISDKGIEHLDKIVSYLGVSRLDLRGSDFSSCTSGVFKSNLMANSSLKELDVSRCKINANVAASMLGGAVFSQTLITLKLWHSQIDVRKLRDQYAPDNKDKRGRGSRWRAQVEKRIDAIANALHNKDAKNEIDQDTLSRAHCKEARKAQMKQAAEIESLMLNKIIESIFY